MPRIAISKISSYCFIRGLFLVIMPIINAAKRTAILSNPGYEWTANIPSLIHKQHKYGCARPSPAD